MFVAAANRVGKEFVKFYGSSFICDPLGKIIACASRFKDEVIDAVLDMEVKK